MRLSLPSLRALAAIALALGALTAAGCGGNDGGGSSATTATQTETGGGGATTAAGAELFKQRCGNCHTLAAADTSGQIGPNLDELRPDEARVLAAIEEGPSAMPPNLLQGAEAEAVARFVAENAGR